MSFPLAPTRRAASGPTHCQAPGCDKALLPNESLSQRKLYCNPACRKRAARAKRKPASPPVACATPGCGKTFASRPGKAYCSRICKSRVNNHRSNPVRGENGGRYVARQPALDALVALGGRASVLRIAGRSGLPVARCLVALRRMQEASTVRLHREPGAPDADVVAEVVATTSEARP